MHDRLMIGESQVKAGVAESDATMAGRVTRSVIIRQKHRQAATPDAVSTESTGNEAWRR
jgi:hypothetical protein